jgi:putative ABC transport system substrate-binding protein
MYRRTSVYLAGWFLVSTVALLACVPSNAQQAAKGQRIGVILASPPGPAYEAFRQGLRELGYIEGQNLTIDLRFSQGQLEQLGEFAAELVRLKADVIVVLGAVTARAVKKVTTTTPIVFVVVVDPVADGVVAKLDQPEANLTGVTSFDPQQSRSQLKLLKEAIPGVMRVAILGDAGISEALLNAARSAAEAEGLKPQAIRIKGPSPDLEGAFAAMTRRADALVVLEEPITFIQRKRIGELAAAHRLPTVFASAGWADAGGLIGYGTSVVDAFRRLSGYVDKILKGAKPADLQVETITKHHLIINLKTARMIGVTIPPGVLKKAQQVIE